MSIHTMKSSASKSLFWGSSVALSWTWGLGLFFAVQFTFQFGLKGLLSFAIPNAIGLFLFGAGTAHIAKKAKPGQSLELIFQKWSTKLSSVFLFYQFIALSLTIFALTRYLFQALDLANSLLLLLLVVIALLAIAFLLGEQFGITKIKYSHAFFYGVLIILGIYIWVTKDTVASLPGMGNAPKNDLNFLGYLIPVCVGFFTGPWLDLQQWQRAIEMHKEKTSIRAGYLVGSLLFFAILLFHGSLTLWAMEQGAGIYARKGIDGIFYAQDMITRLLTSQGTNLTGVLPLAYFAFLIICIITTLDSGYIAVKWHLQHHVKEGKNMLYSILPKSLLTSPIPLFVAAAITALVAIEANLELEYFMVFFATYFVSYAIILIIRSLGDNPLEIHLAKTKIFAISCLSLVIAGLGYIHLEPILLIAGTLIPVIVGGWLATRKPIAAIQSSHQPLQDGQTDSFEDVRQADSLDTPVHSAAATQLAGSDNIASEYVQDKWYVHAFRATYGDTNSVGNVYFGMYAMWVGKTRELFFNYCLPDFDLKKTAFLILTRSFEHKFALEAREFDIIKVKIKVKNFNRKFATLEHRIVDQKERLLGKGSQSLLFVKADTYEQIDIPSEVLAAFTPFTT
ncbi:acyl-CoA thioesterase [Arachidicoccus rhizosphaerae]|nr:acyl-CoA thioesterase [Arachidicoccus rhizosphaerae]